MVLVIKNPPANAEDLREADLTPGLGRSPGGGHSSPLQYSCLENPMDRGACWVTVHRVSKTQMLGVIYLNGNHAPEEKIWKFLNMLGIYEIGRAHV